MGIISSRGSGNLRDAAIVDSLIAAIRARDPEDVVIGCRLHRPVRALAHEHKVAAMMSDIGHERFCLDPADSNASSAFERLIELIEDRHELAEGLAEAVERRRGLVERQFDEVFGEVIAG